MTGRVVYSSFATTRHSGGVHVMAEHVRLLRGTGLDAVLWLPRGAVPSWFDPEVPVLAADELALSADDLLVLPEVPVVPGVDPAPGARAVVLDQNHFYTFAVPWPRDVPYPGWELPPAVWAVSAESADVLRAVLPHLPVREVPPPLDVTLFRPGPRAGPVVAWMPRKRPREAELLWHLLSRDPRLDGVELVEVADLPRAAVAEVLGRTTVFVALGHSEGLGLPVAEALAAGCLVVGYDGGGGRELFGAPGAVAVPEQRPLLLREAVVTALGRPDRDVLARASREWVRERWSDERCLHALLPAVREAMVGPGRATTARHPAAWLDRLGPAFTAWA